MKSTNKYFDTSHDHSLDSFHLPLDWNEDISLEEYLEYLEKNKSNK